VQILTFPVDWSNIRERDRVNGFFFLLFVRRKRWRRDALALLELLVENYGLYRHLIGNAFVWSISINWANLIEALENYIARHLMLALSIIVQYAPHITANCTELHGTV